MVQNYQKGQCLPPQNLRPFTDGESTSIQAKLDRKLEFTDISYRPSNGGAVAYLEGWRAISHANHTFGFNGWSSEIIALNTDFLDVDESSGRVSVGMSCIVRVWLRDGSFHEDVGYGVCEGMKGKAAAFEKARKESVTDAMKRALRVFGDRLGNCAYDKEFLKNVKKSNPIPSKLKMNPQNDDTKENANFGLQNYNQAQPTESPHNNNNPPPGFVPSWTSARNLPATANLVQNNKGTILTAKDPPSDFVYDDYPMYDEEYSTI
jgi:DNA recombination protein Rad52